MKGLLRKDFYMMKSYCKGSILLVLIFLGATIVAHENYLFLLYPFLIVSLFPMTLLSYEEQAGWDRYVGAFPYSKAAVVSSKYVVALLSTAAVALIFAAGLLIRGAFVSGERISLETCLGIFLSMMLLGILSPGLLLPFLLRFGVAKGRVVFICVVAVLAAAVGALGSIAGGSGADAFFLTALNPVGVKFWLFCLAGILYYALSWGLAIWLYRKKEL